MLDGQALVITVHGVNCCSDGESVCELLLANNQLSGSIPSSFGSLSDLTGLYVSGNQLSGSIPSSFGSLSSLKYVELDNNRLSGSIPSSIG